MLYASLQHTNNIIDVNDEFFIIVRIEIVALRHQFAVYQRSVRRPETNPAACVIWPWITRQWSGWRDALIFVQPVHGFLDYLDDIFSHRL